MEILRILFLNLMPDKEACEQEIVEALEATGKKTELIPVKMSNLFYKDTPQAHMDEHYTDIAEVMEANEDYDGLIINGAPFQRFEYEEVVYWTQLKVFFRWSDVHVKSTLYFCWGAFARLYYNYGLHFKRNDFQWSGIYPHTILTKGTGYVDDSLAAVPIPVSRPWYISHDEAAAVEGLDIVAESPVTGPGLLVSHGGKHVYSISHFEYFPERLAQEFERDTQKGLNPMVPINYYENDDPRQPVCYSWRSARDVLFTHWLTFLE